MRPLPDGLALKAITAVAVLPFHSVLMRFETSKPFFCYNLPAIICDIAVLQRLHIAWRLARTSSSLHR